MVKASQDYVCQSCGAVSSKWQGKCPACGAWNSLEPGGQRDQPRRPGWAQGQAQGQGGPDRKPCRGRDSRCGASSPASASSTARRATALRKARRCCSAASPASASRRSSSRRRLPSQTKAIARSISRARRPPAKSACARRGLASPRRRSGLPPKPASSASSQPSSRLARPISSWSIRSRRFGPKPSNRRLAP